MRISPERYSISHKSRNLYPTAVEEFNKIGTIAGLDIVAEASPWQDFERLAAYIFEKNGYSVSVGTVKTRGRQRRQYDVIAEKNGRTLLVECKQWAGNRYRLSALKTAVRKHRERARFYAENAGTEGIPVIVVLIEEEIRVHEGVPLVPVHRLNAFIGELEHWLDGLCFAEYEEEDPAEAWEDPES